MSFGQDGQGANHFGTLAFFYTMVHPVTQLIEAVDLKNKGDESGAAIALAHSFGMEEPNDILSDNVTNLLDNQNAHPIVFKLMEAEEKRRTRGSTRANSGSTRATD